MENIVQVVITHGSDGYVAKGLNVPIVTEGDTFEELEENIRAAVELYFEDENLKELGFGRLRVFSQVLNLLPE